MPNSVKKTASDGDTRQPLNFANRLITAIPRGRRGKHSSIVAKIMADLDQLDSQTAILVPLADMHGEKMENIRSALNRATKLKNIPVATSADDQYFYVWRTADNKPETAASGQKNSSRTKSA